jgi:hypothetical protein
MNFEKLWFFVGKLIKQKKRGLITPKELNDELSWFIFQIDLAREVLMED